MTAYVKESEASAPPPRGLPLSPQTQARPTASALVKAAPGAEVSSVTDEWAEAYAPVLPPADASLEEGPPLAELEAQMHGELAAQVRTEPLRQAKRLRMDSDEAEDEAKGSRALPQLEELTARLPVEVRDTLEELFRAKFVAVKKVPRKAIAPQVNQTTI